MRTMWNLVAVLAAVGLLSLSIQPARACHGRKHCSACAAKAYAGGYGSPGYGCGYAGYGCGSPGYGSGYGWMPNYGYGYPNASGSGGYYYYCYGTAVRPKRESTGGTDGASSEAENKKIKDIEDKLDTLDRRLTTRLNTAASAPSVAANLPTGGGGAPIDMTKVKGAIEEDMKKLESGLNDRMQAMNKQMISEVTLKFTAAMEEARSKDRKEMESGLTDGFRKLQTAMDEARVKDRREFDAKIEELRAEIKKIKP